MDTHFQTTELFSDTIAQLNHKIQILVEKDKNQATRAMHCQTLVNINWQEINVAPLLERISYIDEQLIAVREGNIALKEINQKILKQKNQVDDADQDLRNKKVEHSTSLANFNRYQEKLTQLQQDPSIIPLTPYQKQQLDDRFANFKKPVSLDEAFDKADNEFTTLAMNIFTNFGFQMIVATPLRAVMTLEPFIGGACFVDIIDRRHSAILLIEYDREHQRLRLPEISANAEIAS